MNYTLFLQGLTVGILIASAVFASVAVPLRDRARDENSASRLQLEEYRRLRKRRTEGSDEDLGRFPSPLTPLVGAVFLFLAFSLKALKNVEKR